MFMAREEIGTAIRENERERKEGNGSWWGAIFNKDRRNHGDKAIFGERNRNDDASEGSIWSP